MTQQNANSDDVSPLPSTPGSGEIPAAPLKRLVTRWGKAAVKRTKEGNTVAVEELLGAAKELDQLINDLLTNAKLSREGDNQQPNSTLPSNTGRLEQAKRFALQNFDKWNDVTGFVPPHIGYYYELSSVIEDAVEFGFGVAHGQRWKDIVKHIRPANAKRSE